MKSHDEVGEKSLFWVTYVPAYATGPKKGLSRMRWIRTSRWWIYSFKDDHFEGWFSHLNSDTDFDVGKKRMVSFSRPLEKSHWYRGHLRILGSNLSLSQDLFCSTFCKGKIQNNNPELPRIPLFFRFQRFRSCQGVTNSCRSHWKRLQRSNCSWIQAAMGCKAIGKIWGFLS